MDETKKKEPVYSSKSPETTTVESTREATMTAESSGTESSGQSSKQPQKTQMAVLLEITRTGAYSSLAEFTEFLKRTRRAWLIVAGAIFVLMAMVTLVKRVSDWARNARERRQDQAIATVTPDRLIARCGQPAKDTTKEVYPILMRTISYQPKRHEKLVVAFSRTAEEKSDWVFLSMKDESEARSYDTPESKIAALPCLDSEK
jgi:hypothetical protein